MTNLLSNFVSLRLCTLLAERGLTRDTWAVYREFQDPNEIHISAPAMDFEGLYKPLQLPEGVHARPYVETPAYTLTDMLSLIPGFLLNQKDTMNIEVAAFNIFQLEPITGPHGVADAAAMMVLQVIDRRIIPVDQLNSRLSSSTITK